ISVPNKHVDLIFSSVGAEVYKESKGKQMPYRVSSIMIDDNIYLNAIDADSKQSPSPSSKRTPAPTTVNIATKF
ncbi:unnamed protein product, partial [Rotaria magnacalcarata]